MLPGFTTLDKLLGIQVAIITAITIFSHTIGDTGLGRSARQYVDR
jgi:hypothetical protein